MIGKDCPLIFTHIPKTGGMSLFASMCEYHGMKMADMYNMSAFYEEWDEVEAELKDADKCVYAGHFPFGLHEWLSRPSCYMAIVRKPADRIMSLYYYSIQYRDFIRHECKSRSCSPDELFENRVAADFYRDFMPWIKAAETLNGFLRCPSPELDNGMVRRFSGFGLQAEACPDSALELAMANIENYYTVVGMQERYQESIKMARLAFNVNLTEFHINTGTDKRRSKQKLDTNQRKRLKQLNKLDIKLYDWIAERFDSQLGKSVEPIVVAGGARDDYRQVKLWRAIGQSPQRQSIMRESPNKAG